MILDTATVQARDSLLAFMKEGASLSLFPLSLFHLVRPDTSYPHTALPTACNTLAKMPKATGSPRIIVVAGAALRVADLCRCVTRSAAPCRTPR